MNIKNTKATFIIVSILCLVLALSVVSAVTTASKISNVKKATYLTAKPVQIIKQKQLIQPANMVSSSLSKTQTSHNLASNKIVQEKNDTNITQYECKGDINLDNKVDFSDIDYFNFVKENPGYAMQNTPNMFWRADITDDFAVNQLDVNPFVSLLGKPLTNCRRLLITQPPFPQNWSYCKGDFNADYKIDFSDMDQMAAVVTNPSIVSQNTPWIFATADINNDASVNQVDVDNFVSLLGTNCPSR